MENFAFCSPTHFVLEKSAENKVGALVSSFSKKVLLVHSGESFVRESGLYSRVQESLQQAGVIVVELTGVVPNPVLSLVHKGIEICREQGIGFILSMGGGSVVDTAKAIALGACYTGDVWDLFCGVTEPTASLPTGAIMTLPATGSEASNGAVITNEKTGQKKDVMGDILRPAFCLMNPELTYSLPTMQTVYGVADMFSHITERYFSNSAGVQVTDRLCEGLLVAVVECGQQVLQAPKEYDLRANLMWAAIIAHNGLLGTGRNQGWETHMMGAVLSGEYGCIHGATIAVLLPVWAEYASQTDPEKFSQFAQRVFSIEKKETEQETAQAGIQALRNFFIALGLPSRLRDIGVPNQDEFSRLAQQACSNGTIGCIRPLQAADIEKIYQQAF